MKDTDYDGNVTKNYGWAKRRKEQGMNKAKQGKAHRTMDVEGEGRARQEHDKSTQTWIPTKQQT